MARVLGLDFGTGGVRVGVFDVDRGVMLAEREERYAIRHPRPGWAEQSPLDWWEALGKATRGLMTDLGGPDIAGVWVATMASTVVVVQARRDAAAPRPPLDGLPRRRGGGPHGRVAPSGHGLFRRRRRSRVAGPESHVARAS